MMGGLEPERNVTPADWIVERLWPWNAEVGTRVGALVPEGFEAYARVLHSGDGLREGTLADPELDAMIAMLGPSGCWFCVWIGFGWWTPSAPFRRPPRDLREHVAHRRDDARLRREQRDARDALHRMPMVRTPGRRYLLFRGVTEDARRWMGFPAKQSPNIWWPEDRSWCVATEIDLDSTLIGGSRPLIDTVLASEDLEAFEVTLDDRLDAEGDSLDR